MPASDSLAAGSTALITGSASGIGLAIAKLFRSKSMNVILVDLSADALSTAKTEVESTPGSGSVATIEADVASLPDWARVKEQAGSIEVLVLNAGTTAKGGWGDGEYFRKILEVNLFGVINGINTLLPVVQASTKPSSVIITGSKQGITNPPGNAAYNASKSAVKTLAEHLSWDLRETSTSVHLLVPGWTFTGMTRGDSEEKPAGAWYPEQVAEYLYGKMQKDEFYAICPDNDVSEATDKTRILYTAGDIVRGRPPLSRWRAEWKAVAEEEMAKTGI